jgi:hypothetical protein
MVLVRSTASRWLTYGMLPSVNAEKRLELTDDGILVGVCSDANLASLSVLDKPGPAAALDTSQSGVELLLHFVQAAICAIDGLSKTTRWRISTTLILGREVLPEQGVVPVPTSMEVDQRLEGNLGSNVVVRLGGGILVSSVVV